MLTTRIVTASLSAKPSTGPASVILNLNLSTLRSTTQVGRPGELLVRVDGAWVSIDGDTTIWWRRAGSVDLTGLEPDEARLVQDEGPHLLHGGLMAAGVRWVDDPFATARAETKQHQLATATALGIPVPKTVVTNDVVVARQFAQDQPTIAKPLSPGHGIAPYVDLVSAEDIELITTNPTLLQEYVPAAADLRIVTICGYGTWTWRRPREGVIDWRAVDPHGEDFVQIHDPELGVSAARITEALGLTISVQDWLQVDGAPVFLEANPQGAFLFLAGSISQVVPALVEHLRP